MCIDRIISWLKSVYGRVEEYIVGGAADGERIVVDSEVVDFLNELGVSDVESAVNQLLGTWVNSTIKRGELDIIANEEEE